MNISAVHYVHILFPVYNIVETKYTHNVMRFIHQSNRLEASKMKSEYLQTLIVSLMMGSFSKAAENLCVTQSAVSRRIQFLEDQYGCPLVDRSGPVLKPTGAGQIVLEKAEKMMALEKELLQDLKGLTSMPGVTFCCTPAFGIAYLPEIMQTFMLSHSGISEMKFFFELPDKVVEGLREGIYQAGVIEHYECFDLGDFKTFSLPDDELVFVTSPDLGVDTGTVSIDQLLGNDLYLRSEGCCSSKMLAFNMDNIGRDCAEFARTIVCDDLHLILRAAREGNGITFASRTLVAEHVKQGTLREHKIKGFNHTHQRTLIVNTTIPANPLLTDFISSIFGVFGSPPPVSDI